MGFRISSVEGKRQIGYRNNPHKSVLPKFYALENYVEEKFDGDLTEMILTVAANGIKYVHQVYSQGSIFPLSGSFIVTPFDAKGLSDNGNYQKSLGEKNLEFNSIRLRKKFGLEKSVLSLVDPRFADLDTRSLISINLGGRAVIVPTMQVFVKTYLGEEQVKQDLGREISLQPAMVIALALSQWVDMKYGFTSKDDDGKSDKLSS
jgi:hypothetical protein